MIMATYKRVSMLTIVLDHYCHEDAPLDRIVVVWNDPNTSIPSSVTRLGEKCSKHVNFVSMKKNKMTNRFLPQNLDGIASDCE